MTLHLVYTTLADNQQARELCNALLKDKLIACANIFPGMESHYLWQGEPTQSSEVAVLLKTTQAKLTLLQQRLNQLHPYDTPCIITLGAADTNPDFLSWAAAQTQ